MAYNELGEFQTATGDLHAVAGAGQSEAGLVSLAGRRVPCLAVCDGEAGLLERVPILSTLTVRSGENSYLAFVCPHDMLLMLLVTVLLLLFRKAPPDVY